MSVTMPAAETVAVAVAPLPAASLIVTVGGEADE